MNTDAAPTTDGEGFWTRVRGAIGALRPEGERVPAYGQAAIARSGGLGPRLPSRIEEELTQGWAKAAARKVSISLIVVELDCATDYLTAYGKTTLDETLMEVMRAITQCLPRTGDMCLRLGRSGFVMVLPDMPGLMARAAVGKMDKAVRLLNLPHKESHAGIVTVSAGLAIGNPVGEFDRALFDTAAEAIKRAQRKGLSRLEVVDMRPAQERQRQAA